MKDKSLEEIDILKLVIYVFSFISICTALILFILLPILKEHKKLSSKLSYEDAVLMNAKNTLKFHQDKLANLKIENNISFSQFQTAIDNLNFKNLLAKYFKNIKIAKVKNNESDKYLKEKLQIDATMENQAQFYFFIDELKKYKNLIKITYPMIINVNNKNINITFKAEVYSAK